MPRTPLSNNSTAIALAGLLAFLAGCASSTPPSVARANLQAPQDLEQIPVTASVNEARNPPPGQPGVSPYYSSVPPQGNAYPPGNAAQDYAAAPPANYPAQSSAGYPQQQPTYASAAPGYLPAGPPPYGQVAVMTTRYVDPNVVPVGATGVAPAGSALDAGSSPAGPPPGYAGPGPAPIIVEPVSASPKKSDDDNEWDWSHLAPDYTWKEFKQAIGFGPDHKLAREAYDKGQALFNVKNYDEAAKEFNTATWRWPDSTMEEDAMFLMAESYFFADHYGSAQDSYTNLLKAHDNTRYLDTVIARLFAIGTYWEQLDLQTHNWPVTPNVTDKTQPWFDTYGNAMACYEAVWLHDPTGPLADAALFRVANAHFRRGEWEDAAEHYDHIRKNHPKSKFQKDAHLRELQAKMQIYQGPKYSIVPLNDAQEIADQTLKQFPGQLGDEERRVRETRGKIFEQRAEREWVMAQYYDNKREFRAAREYYKVLLDKYSQTSFGAQARQRMQEIRNEPDEPPNHFAWLTNLFGKGK